MNSTALITILNQCSLGYLSEEDKKNKNKNGVFQNGGVTTNNLVKTSTGTKDTDDTNTNRKKEDKNTDNDIQHS
jgi:hypothetical protein